MDLKNCVIKSILSFCGFQNCIYVVVMPWCTVFVEKGGGKEGVDKWVYALFSPCYDYFIFISEEMWENATDFKSVVLLLMCVCRYKHVKSINSHKQQNCWGVLSMKEVVLPLYEQRLSNNYCVSAMITIVIFCWIVSNNFCLQWGRLDPKRTSKIAVS